MHKPQKNFSDPTSAPKLAQKAQNDPKNQKIKKWEKKKIYKMKVFSLHELTSKNFSDFTSTSKNSSI